MHPTSSSLRAGKMAGILAISGTIRRALTLDRAAIPAHCTSLPRRRRESVFARTGIVDGQADNSFIGTGNAPRANWFHGIDLPGPTGCGIGRRRNRNPCAPAALMAGSARLGMAPRFCCRSSVVEHSLGKGEVDSSILSGSTRKNPKNRRHLADFALASSTTHSWRRAGTPSFSGFTAKQLRATPSRCLGFLIASGHCCDERAILLPYIIFEHDLETATDVETAFILTRKFTIDRILIFEIPRLTGTSAPRMGLSATSGGVNLHRGSTF